MYQRAIWAVTTFHALISMSRKAETTNTTTRANTNTPAATIALNRTSDAVS